MTVKVIEVASRRWLGMGVAVLALGLVAGACGDDGDGASSLFGEGGSASEDDIADLAEDFASGDLDLPQSVDEAEEMLEGLELGSGAGQVTIADVTYDFEAEVCVVFDDDFTAEGPATGSDGSVAWVSINSARDTRDEMKDFVDEETLDMLFGDEDVIQNASVSVAVGREDMFGSAPEGLPDWTVDSAFQFGEETLTYSLDGSTLRGEGTIADLNGVAVDFGASAPVSFEASCG